MALPKVVQYIRNVGKSVVYASVDNIREDMPNIAAVVDHSGNKEVYKNIYEGLRDYRTTYRRATAYIKSSKLYEAGDLGIKAAAEDIKTGKWYNKERIDAISESIMGSFDDIEDMGDEDDISFNDSTSDISEGDRLIVGSTQVAAIKNAEMISNAVVNSSRAQMKHSEASTNLLYSQQFKLFGELRSDIINTSTRSIQEQSKTNAIMETMANNSKAFYEDTGKTLKEIHALLKETTEMQRNIYSSPEKKDGNRKITIDDLLDSNGVLDLQEYGKLVGRNAKNVLSEKTGGMLDVLSGFGDGNALKMFTANPLGSLLKMGLRGMAPKTLSAAMKRLDTTIGGVAGTALARISNMGRKEDGNPIFQTLGQIFGVNTSVKSSLDPGKFTKGPVPFDGVTRATINKAIPGYLSRIESALTGMPAKVYDPRSGRWTTVKDLKLGFDNLKQSSIRSSTSDLASEIAQAIFNNKKYKAATADDKKQIEDNFKNFMEAIYENNGDFKLKSYDDFYEYGVSDPEIFKMLVSALKTSRSRIGTATEVMSAKSSLNRRMKAMEEEGDIYDILFSNAYDVKAEAKRNKNYNEGPKSGIASSLVNYKDALGHDMLYYLKNIYDENYRIRNAVGGSGPVYNGGGSLSSRTFFGTGKEFRTIDGATANHPRVKTERDRYLRSQQSAKTRYDEEIQKFIDEGGKTYDLTDGAANARIIANLSEEDRRKAQRDLERSGNFFQNALYKQHFDKDYINAQREKRGESALEGNFKERFKNAKLEEKFQMLVNQANKITSQPAKWLTEAIQKTDQRIYDFFYGAETGEEDEEGNDIRGMMNLMVMKFNQSLNKMTDWADEKIFEPLKKKLGVESMEDLLKKIGVTDLMDGLKQKILGTKEDGKWTGGILSDFWTNTKDAFKDKFDFAKDFMKESFQNVLGPVVDKVKSAFKSDSSTASEHEVDIGSVEAASPIVGSLANRFKVDPNATIDDLKRELSADLKKYKLPNSEMITWCTSEEDVISIEKSVIPVLNRGKAKNGITNEVKASITKKFKRLKFLFKRKKAKEEAEKKGKNVISNVTRGATEASKVSQDSIMKSLTNGVNVSNLNRKNTTLNPMSGPIAALQKRLGVKPGSPEGKLIEAIIMDKAGGMTDHMSGKFLNEMSMGDLVGITNNDKINKSISRIMKEEFGNRDVSVNEFLMNNKSMQSINGGRSNTPNNIFAKINESIQKIYEHLKKVTDGDAIVTVDKSDKPAPINTTGFVENIREGVTGRSRESETEAAPQDSQPDSSAFGGFFKKAGRSALSEGEIYGKDGLYGKVPKTGVYDVAAGTTIYPTKKNKAIELSNESKAIDKFIMSNAEADSARTKVINGISYVKRKLKESGKEVWVRYENGKAYILDENNLPQKMVETGKEGIKQVVASYKNMSTSKVKIDPNGNVKSIAKDIKNALPDITAGGALGAAAGLLAGNPLLGAAVGASVSFVGASDTAKDMLFGKMATDANGNNYRTGGLISKEVQDTVSKYLPSAASHAVVGAGLGLLTPFGAVGGMLIGGAIGAAKKSDTIMTALFGDSSDEDSGLISKKTRDTMKKYAPNIALGALGGILTGPFGIVGNAVLGSGLGFLTTSEDFKSYILGEEIEVDGEKTRVGGLVGTIKTEVVDPFVGWGKNFIEETTDFLKNKVLNPLADAVPAITHEIIHIGAKTVSFIPKLIGNMTAAAFKTPIGSAIASALSPVRKLIGGASKVAGTVAKGTILAPVTAISALGNAAKRAQIKRGDASYMMSAAERNAYRDSHKGFGGKDDKFAAIDKTLENSTDDQITKATELAKKLSCSKNFFRQATKGKIRTICKLASLYFIPKDAKAIIKACKNSQFNRAIEIIETATPKDSLQFTPDMRRGIIDKINSCINDVKYADRKNNLVGEARQNAFKQLEGLGFKGVSDSNLEDFFKNLDKEGNYRKNADQKTEEEKQAEKNIENRTEQTDRVIEAIDNATTKISDALTQKNVHTEADDLADAKSLAALSNVNVPSVDTSFVGPLQPGKTAPRYRYDDKTDTLYEYGKKRDLITKDNGFREVFNKETGKIEQHRTTKDDNGEEIEEIYDEGSNNFRRFKRGTDGKLHEIAGKGKSDADKAETEDAEKKAGLFAKILAKHGLTFNGKTKDEKGEKKEGIIDKIKKFFGKGLGFLGKAALGITGVAAVGHGYEAAKDVLVPKLTTFWNDTAAPWLDEKLGGRLTAISEGITSFVLNLPDKIRSGIENALNWVNENKSKVLTWYSDGLQASAGMVADAAKLLVSIAPSILKGLGKYVVIPILKGTWEGIKTWGRGEEPSLANVEDVSSINTSGIDSTITNGKAAASRLGWKFNSNSSNVDLSFSKPVTTSSGATINYEKSTKASTAAERFDLTNGTVSMQERIAGAGLRKLTGAATSPLIFKGMESVGNGLSHLGFMGKAAGLPLKGIGTAGEAVLNKIPNLGEKFVTGNFGSNAMRLGTKMAGSSNKFIAGIGNKIANSTIAKAGTEAVSKSAGTKLATKVVQEGAEGAAEKGLLSKLTKFITENISKIFKSTAVKKFTAEAMQTVGKEATDEVVETALNKASQGIIKKLVKEAGEQLAKAGATLLAKVSSAIGTLGISTVLFSVADFTFGTINARDILGLTKSQDISFGERFLAGLLACVNGFITLGLIPESTIVDIFLEHVAPMFNIDVSDITSRREAAYKEVAEYNEANPNDKMTVAEYNHKDGIGSKIKNFFLGKKENNSETDSETGSKSDENKRTGGVVGAFKSGAKAATDVAGNVFEAAGKGLEKFTSNVKMTSDAALKGDIRGMLFGGNSFITEEGDLDVVTLISNLANIPYKYSLIIPTLFMAGVNLVKEPVKKFADDVSTEFNGMITRFKDVGNAIKDGDPIGMFNMLYMGGGETTGSGSGYGLGSAITGVFGVVPLALSTFSLIGKQIKGLTDSIAAEIEAVQVSTEADTSAMKALADKGDFKAIWNYIPNTDETGAFRFCQGANILFTKFTTIPGAIITNISKTFDKWFNFGSIDFGDMASKMGEYINCKKHPTMDGFDNIGNDPNAGPVGNGLAGVFRKIGGFVVRFGRMFTSLDGIIRWLKGDTPAPSDDTSTTTDTTSTTGKGKGSNTGRVYQRDPRYGGMSFNRSGDKSIQTVADSGCGPVAAVNAVNYAYGTGNNMESAVGMARNYKEIDGGTKPEFFDKYFKDNGLNSKRLYGNGIEANLASGNPTILMGTDPKGGYSTPYGPNPHYVTARGFDSKGRIIIDDPENPYGSTVYDKNKVLDHTSIAIGTSKYGTGRYGRGTDHIGYYVAEFESGDKGPAMISSGKGDAGGVSFGTYQLASYKQSVTTKGDLPKFWNKYYASQYPGVSPGDNAAFKSAWTSAVNANPTQFQQNEVSFMYDAYYRPIRNDLISSIGLDPDTQSRGFQELCWAMSIQFGSKSAANKISTALGSNWKSMTQQAMIEKVSNYIADNVGTFFKSSSKDVQKGVADRYRNRQKNKLLQLVNMKALDSTNVASSGSAVELGGLNSTTTQSNSDYAQLGTALSNLVKSSIKAVYGDSVSAIFGEGSGNSYKYGKALTYRYGEIKSIYCKKTGAWETVSAKIPADDITIHGRNTKPDDNAWDVKGTFGWWHGNANAYISKETAIKYNILPKADMEDSKPKTTTAKTTGKLPMNSLASQNRMIANSLTNANTTSSNILTKSTNYNSLVDKDPSKWPTARVVGTHIVFSNSVLSNEAIQAYTNKVNSYPGAKLAVRVNAYNDAINAAKSRASSMAVGADNSSISAIDTQTLDSGTMGTNTTQTTSSSSGGIGGIFDVFKSAFMSAFDYTDKETGEKRNLLSVLGFGGSTSDSSSSTSFSTSTTVGAAPAGLSTQQANVYSQMSKIMGKNDYSQSNRDRVDATLNGASRGSGDCSSTVRWALRTGAGVDPGSYTGAQIESANGVWVDGAYSLGDGAKPDIKKLAVGDLMFYGRQKSSNPRKVSHVEMYFGDGKRVGHGSGVGPKISDYTAMASDQSYLGAKRFIPVGSDSNSTSNTTTGMGSANVSKGYISSGFDDPTRSSHNGIDIAAASGEPITSNIDGEVVRSEYNDTDGNIVVIRDGKGRLHTFKHMLKTNLTVGQRVNTGMIIGHVGSTGASAGSHVHVSVSNPDGQYVDPITNKPSANTRPIGGENTDYTSFLTAIIELLATMTDNSKKIDTLISLLTGISDKSTPQSQEAAKAAATQMKTNATSMNDKIRKLLNTNGVSGIGGMLQNNNASSIIETMSQIASQ